MHVIISKEEMIIYTHVECFFAGFFSAINFLLFFCHDVWCETLRSCHCVDECNCCGFKWKFHRRWLLRLTMGNFVMTTKHLTNDFSSFWSAMYSFSNGLCMKSHFKMINFDEMWWVIFRCQTLHKHLRIEWKNQSINLESQHLLTVLTWKKTVKFEYFFRRQSSPESIDWTTTREHKSRELHEHSSIHWQQRQELDLRGVRSQTNACDEIKLPVTRLTNGEPLEKAKVESNLNQLNGN